MDHIIQPERRSQSPRDYHRNRITTEFGSAAGPAAPCPNRRAYDRDVPCVRICVILLLVMCSGIQIGPITLAFLADARASSPYEEDYYKHHYIEDALAGDLYALTKVIRNNVTYLDLTPDETRMVYGNLLKVPNLRQYTIAWEEEDARTNPGIELSMWRALAFAFQKDGTLTMHVRDRLGSENAGEADWIVARDLARLGAFHGGTASASTLMSIPDDRKEVEDFEAIVAGVTRFSSVDAERFTVKRLVKQLVRFVDSRVDEDAEQLSFQDPLAETVRHMLRNIVLSTHQRGARVWFGNVATNQILSSWSRPLNVTYGEAELVWIATHPDLDASGVRSSRIVESLVQLYRVKSKKNPSCAACEQAILRYEEKEIAASLLRLLLDGDYQMNPRFLADEIAAGGPTIIPDLVSLATMVDGPPTEKVAIHDDYPNRMRHLVAAVLSKISDRSPVEAASFITGMFTENQLSDGEKDLLRASIRHCRNCPTVMASIPKNTRIALFLLAVLGCGFLMFIGVRTLSKD